VIHPTAVIHPSARLADGVEVGAFATIGPDVEVGPGTVIGAHAALEGPARIGPNNRIHAFCAIGGPPQDKKFQPDPRSRLEIGEGNTFREYVSVNRGTVHGGGTTRIGDQNWLMAYCHVAHDCQIGNYNVLANTTNLAGHVEIGNYVTLGGYTGVHQFCRVGDYGFTAIAAVVVRDVTPYIIAAGNIARARGLNRVGLRRNGFSEPDMAVLKTVYRLFFRSKLPLDEALREIESRYGENDRVRAFLEFVSGTRRGVIR